MGQLMITSETGFPHSACRFSFDSAKRTEWWGFVPARSKRPAGHGKLDPSDRTHLINHSIVFDINDDLLARAMNDVVSSYRGVGYMVLGKDCVSFSADVARQCRLRVPLVNFTPYGLLAVLALWNKKRSFT